MPNNHSEIEKRLWASADELRANSKLKSSEYSVPVLGLIFLRYADHKFAIAEKELAGKGTGGGRIGKEDYQAKGVMYLPPAGPILQAAEPARRREHRQGHQRGDEGDRGRERGT